ncbi:MAG TPA: hypothetical protein VMT87_13360 [Vicinamibacteria bacterium]|nr:hypothetical protein [Vicinamibacteria bacterium]
MTRSRLVVFASMLVVGVGVVAGVGALYLDPARAAVGPLEAEALALPADSRFVIGLDVKRFVSSPFYARFGDGPGQARPDAFADLEEKLGLDPERDLDRVVIAGRDPSGMKKDPGVALITGRFDRYKLGRAAEEKPGVTTKNHEGTSMYLYDEEKKGATAVAFLDDTTLALGSQSAVEAVITNRANGSGGLRANTALMALLETVKPGSTFWMAGDQSMLARMPTTLPGGGGTGMQIPALRSMVVTGDLDPVVALQVTGETADAAAAQNLADLVRGVVAMVSLQAAQKPELAQLASAVSVTTQEHRVQVNARLPYELLETLQPKKKSASSPTHSAP